MHLEIKKMNPLLGPQIILFDKKYHCLKKVNLKDILIHVESICV